MLQSRTGPTATGHGRRHRGRALQLIAADFEQKRLIVTEYLLQGRKQGIVNRLTGFEFEQNIPQRQIRPRSEAAPTRIGTARVRGLAVLGNRHTFNAKTKP